MGLTVDSSELTFLPSSKLGSLTSTLAQIWLYQRRKPSSNKQIRMTQKLGQISNIQPDQIQILCLSLRMSSQLPAPIVNGRDSF